MCRIQTLTRTCPVIAQVFFKFATRCRSIMKTFSSSPASFPSRMKHGVTLKQNANIHWKTTVDMSRLCLTTELVVTTVKHQIPEHTY